MCLGIPMQVIGLSPGHARVHGRGQHETVNTALVGTPALGDWLLVFMGNAREAISAERAAEVNAALDLVAQSLSGRHLDGAADPGFALPSAMGAAQLAALTGTPPAVFSAEKATE